MITFELKDNEFITLCDLLKRTGLCESGGFAKSVIAEGLVEVDGQQELRKRCKITANKTITYNNETIKVIT